MPLLVTVIEAEACALPAPVTVRLHSPARAPVMVRDQLGPLALVAEKVA